MKETHGELSPEEEYQYEGVLKMKLKMMTAKRNCLSLSFKKE
jgi:hypothetical protein